MSRSGGSDGELVLLTVCHSVVEATVLRSALEAHEIFCFVQGEHHRQLLGQFGTYVDLRVMVPRRQLEEARALLADLRQNPPALEGEGDEDDAPLDPRGAPPARSEGAVVRRALLPAFGAAHLHAGAPGRGLLVMIVEVTGVVVALSWGEVVIGAALAAGGVLADALGARALVRRLRASQLPAAVSRERG